MPILPELLEQLKFISPEAFLLGLFFSGAVVLVVRDWRFLILALLLQYIIAGLILSRLVRPDLAALKMMIGTFVCPILFLSVRQVGSILPPAINVEVEAPPSRFKWVNSWRKTVAVVRPFLVGRNRHRGLVRTGFVFRLLAALLMMLAASLLSQMVTLPGLPLNVTTAVYWLLLAGFVTLSLNEDPLKVGLGLFMVFIGFDLFYTPLESGLLMTGLWGSVNLLVALAVGYLIVAKGAIPEEDL
jgi:hypothetical protein